MCYSVAAEANSSKPAARSTRLCHARKIAGRIPPVIAATLPRNTMAITEADVQRRLQDASPIPTPARISSRGKAVRKVARRRRQRRGRRRSSAIRRRASTSRCASWCTAALASCPASARVERQRHAEDHVARGAARREAGARRQEHHRGRIGKGGVGKSTTAVNLALALAAEGAQRRRARRRHLRPVAADDARHHRPARIEGRQDARAAGGLRRAGDVDRLPDRHRHADGLARADGDAGARAAAEGHQLARPRLPGRRHAARHRRHPADACAEGAGHRRGHRHDAAGHRADRCAQGPQDVREGRRADRRHRREHEHPHLLEVRPRRAHLRRRRRRAHVRATTTCRSSARCRSTSASASRPTRARPTVVADPDGTVARRSTARSRARPRSSSRRRPRTSRRSFPSIVIQNT